MRAAFLTLGWAIAATAAFGQASYDLGPAKETKVLYAGVLDTPRARVFTEFLKANFTHVETLDVTALNAAAAQPFDVVVCDGKRVYPMKPADGLNLPQCSLGPDFSKPIVMIGAMGGTVQHHTKIDWL